MDWNNVETLRKEIEHAETFMQGATRELAVMVARYHGAAFGESGVCGDDPINHGLDMIATVVPRVVFQTPEVDATSARAGAPREVGIAMRAGLTRWSKDTNFVGLVERCIIDGMFSCSVAVISQVPTKNRAELKAMKKKAKKAYNKADGGVGSVSSSSRKPSSKTMWSSVNRLAPTMFGFDPACEDISDARFIYHKFARDLDDLIAESKLPGSSWNRSVLEQIPLVDGVARGISDISPRTAPQRRDVMLAEVWVREHQMDGYSEDDGYNGTIFTVALDTDGKNVSENFPRKPRPFYGPAWGPYVFDGVYSVPSNPLKLSPIASVHKQVMDVNNVERAITKAVEEYKRLFGVNSGDVSSKNKIVRALHNYMVPLANAESGKMQQIEVGGITPEQLLHAEKMLTRLERASGLSDAARGAVTGEATAYENAIANESSSVRFDYMAKFADRFAQKCLRTVAWYMFHDDRVVFPVGVDDFKAVPGSDKIGNVALWFEGGSHDKDAGYTYDDLEITIEAGSMRKRNTAQRRAEYVELLQITASFIPVVPATPWVKWGMIFKDLGEHYEKKDWHTMFDFEMAGSMPPPEEPKTQGQVTSPIKLNNSSKTGTGPDATKIAIKPPAQAGSAGAKATKPGAK